MRDAADELLEAYPLLPWAQHSDVVELIQQVEAFLAQGVSSERELEIRLRFRSQSSAYCTSCGIMILGIPRTASMTYFTNDALAVKSHGIQCIVLLIFHGI